MRYFGSNIKLIVNSVAISYTDQGSDDAPVLIFIHGFPLNKSMWDKQMEALKENYRVIAYDIRGHGDSDAGNEEFSIELFVSDLLSLMDVLKIDKASLCGLSMGGYIVLNAIEHYPERFLALVLSDTQCLSDSKEAKEKRKTAMENITKNGIEKYADETLKNLFAPDSFTMKKEEIAAVKEMILTTSEQSLCSTLLALSNREETCGKLPEINVPVLFMVGKEDIITPVALAEQMHKKIKNSKIHVIERAGHLSNMENPDDFNHQLRLFFETIYKDRNSNNIGVETSVLGNIRNKLSMFLSFGSV
jgi:3-oxoadipate enol-lactonase